MSPFRFGSRQHWLRIVSAGLFATASGVGFAQLPGGPPPLNSPAPSNAPPGAAVQPMPEVVGLEIVGNKHIDRNKIVQKLKTRAGRPFDPEQLERDLRELNRSGWFIEVKPKTRLAEGGLIVTFDVVERPRLNHVKFLGNERIGDARLQKEAKIKKGDPLSPYEVEEARAKIEQFYQERGFNRVQVSILEGKQISDPGAVFLIHEGTPQKISWTTFEGNTIVSDARLKTQIQSKPGVLWIFRGQLDPKKIKEDEDRITAYYRGLGYFRAVVNGRSVENPEENWVHVRFYIHEGPRYNIRSVAFAGNRVLDTAALNTDLEVSGGQPFDQVKLNKDLTKIREQYGSRGYVFADIKADPRFDEESNNIDLVYRVDEGERYRIGKINVLINGVDGSTGHTRHNVVRNHLSVYPGDVADTRQIQKSQIRLQRSGLFEVDPSKGASPQLKFVKTDDPEGGGRNVARNKPPQVRGQSPDEELDVYEVQMEGRREIVAVPRRAAKFVTSAPQPASASAAPAVTTPPAPAPPALTPPAPTSSRSYYQRQP